MSVRVNTRMHLHSQNILMDKHSITSTAMTVQELQSH